VKKRNLKLSDIAKNGDVVLTEINPDEMVPLPPPYDKRPNFKQLTPDQQTRLTCNLDGFVALALPKPKSKEEEEKYIRLFISGLKKLLSKENNWTFLQPLLLSLDHCARCQTCSDACPVFIASGRNDLYRPTYRAEVFRRLIKKYAGNNGTLLSKLSGIDIELNWATISRLYELSYRCMLCRRCAQACPMSVDNALITRELRKLFSQELGWAPKELHEKGTVLQLETGSPTGMRPDVAMDNIKFLDDDFSELSGFKVKTPWDKVGSDVLFLPGAGDILSFPESIMAVSILCTAAGINWTLSSDIAGYDAVNYGLFYDDIQLAKIVSIHAQIAKKLKVKKILIGECGHAHKALISVADRLLTGDLDIPRESIIVFLDNIVFGGKIKFDLKKNNFPVTLHDPCNIVRNLGIVEPQRRILRYLCPQFREMTPYGVENICCGGGGGLDIIDGINISDWRAGVAGRLKFKQVLDAFADKPGPDVKKYICAPCLNCKIQFRDMIKYYGAREKSGLYCGGLAELIVNAMTDIRKPYIKFEEG
jgi:Fe-S oxidoreductase